MTNWNPEQYEKFLKDRTRPAIDLAIAIQKKYKAVDKGDKIEA